MASNYNGTANGGMDTLGIGGIGNPAPSTTATAIAGATTSTAPVPPKRPVRRGGKAQPERPIRALFCLGLKNPIRKLCIEIVEWKYPFFLKRTTKQKQSCFTTLKLKKYFAVLLVIEMLKIMSFMIQHSSCYLLG